MKLDPRMKDALILGLAFSFMMAIFAPLDAYMANADEFWFGLKDLLPIVLGVFFICFCVLGMLFYATRNSKLFLGIYSFLLSAYVYFYLQGNYAPRKYGVLDGRTIDWSAYESYGMISLALILICLVFWGVSVLKLRDRVYKIGRYIAAFLLLIQISTLGILLVQKVILEPEDKGSVTVTDKGLLELSKNRNIIVFILDTFDSAYMEKMMEAPYAEHTRAIFKDFTYYPDTVGAYPWTAGGIPFILTGQWYENEEPYKGYIAKAYNQTRRYRVLKDHNFSVGLYTLPKYLSPSMDNVVNLISGEYVIKNCFDFLKKLYRLVAFYYMPHQVKSNFYITMEQFDEHQELKKRANQGTEKIASYSWDTQNFYEYFKNNPWNFSENGAFRVYHLTGVHSPYTFGVNLISDENDRYTVVDEIQGCFTLMEEYLQCLKREGIYEQSAIIVMADHGELDLRQRPLFMIKNVKESHDFRVSNEKMSFDYLDDLIITLIEKGQIDDSLIAESRKRHTEQRRFLYFNWDDESWTRRYLHKMTEIYFGGKATDHTQMRFSGRIFEPGGVLPVNNYTLGEELLFNKGQDTATPYCTFGFSAAEQTGMWTNGHSATMHFDIKDEHEDLLLEIRYSSFGKQKVEISANGYLIADFVAVGDEEKSLVIPNSCITEGGLTLGFALPDAVSPRTKGKGADARDLALYMKSLKISRASSDATKKMTPSSRQYTLGEDIFFDKVRATANRYILGGFSVNESNGTWTEGHEVTLEFDLEGIASDLMLAMDFHSYGHQRVEVYVNDNRIGDFVANGDATKTLPIPQDALTGGKLILRFALPDAISPKAQGKGDDGRDLALYLKSMKISAASG